MLVEEKAKMDRGETAPGALMRCRTMLEALVWIEVFGESDIAASQSGMPTLNFSPLRLHGHGTLPRYHERALLPVVFRVFRTRLCQPCSASSWRAHPESLSG